MVGQTRERERALYEPGIKRRECVSACVCLCVKETGRELEKLLDHTHASVCA